MKKIILTCLLGISLTNYAYAVNNKTSGNSIDQNNAYASHQENTPNASNRAYSGAQFPSENSLNPKGATSPVTTMDH